MNRDLLVMILAGGEGRRLLPLTLDRAKPAVPFGGRYRLIDFVLSNFVNSGFFCINILTQYKSDSLSRHISRGWRLSHQVDQYIEIVPAQQRTGKHWYQGSADAIFQNLNLVRDNRPRDIAVFGSDHIYKMDVSQMLDVHRDRGASLTVAAIPVPIEQAHQFGVFEVDSRGEVIAFEEKPERPKAMPNDPSRALASMGNYIFAGDDLVEQLVRDAADGSSAHDFGKNIISGMVEHPTQRVFVYDFSTNEIPGQSEKERGYWRDVGTIDAYWQASMDLISIVPQFDLYNRRWPTRTFYDHVPPAKFVHDDPVSGRIGTAINSIVAEGCIVSGGLIRDGVLFPRVRVNSFATIEGSVLFERVKVGRRARIRRAILDKDVIVEQDATIGYDLQADRERFEVSPGGIVVVPKGTRVTA